MASEENIGKLHRIAQLGSDEVIEYENFRETLLKSIDKELDVDQVMIKMLEVSEGQSLGTYKNGVFIFSTDIMKSAEKLVHEENRRIPGTKEYEMAHQNDKTTNEQEDLSALPMIEKCKRFAELSYEQRQEIISRFPDLNLDEKIATIESLRGEVESLRKMGAAPEPILDESEHEISISRFLTYKLAYVDEKDPSKKAELLENVKLEARTLVGYYLKKLDDKDSLSEKEYENLLVEFANVVGESLENVKDALSLEEEIKPEDWIEQAVYNVKKEAFHENLLKKLSENTSSEKIPQVMKEKIDLLAQTYRKRRDIEEARSVVGLTYASNAIEQTRAQGVTLYENFSEQNGEKSLGNTDELRSKDSVSISNKGKSGYFKSNEYTCESYGVNMQMMETYKYSVNLYGYFGNFEEHTPISAPETRLGKFFAKRNQEKREAVVAEKVQRNFSLENEQLPQEGEQLRRKIDVDFILESYTARRGAIGQIFSTSKPGPNIPPITDAEMSRKKGILSEDLIVGDATISEIISNDIVGKITPEPIAPEIVTPEPVAPEVVTPEPIVAEELNVEDEKINQGAEPVTQTAVSQSSLPKEITESDKMRRGFWNIGKKISNVIKAIVSQDKSKGLFARIAEALNDSDTSNVDTTGTTSTSSSAGPAVENKPVQAPVDYLNTQFKLDFKQASQEAKAAEAKAAQGKEGAGELTQEEYQL